MSSKKSTEKLDRVVSQARIAREEREKSYRVRALKMYPWVCGRCAREFDEKNLQELTVHHRDHTHLMVIPQPKRQIERKPIIRLLNWRQCLKKKIVETFVWEIVDMFLDHFSA
jgi:hypothetical protein